MTTEHPITPPEDKFKRWEDDILNERENVDVVLDCAWKDAAEAAEAAAEAAAARAAARLRQRDLLLRLIAETPVVENTNDH